METGLKGKNVLITGASRNMGRLAALQFAQEGANLAICTSSKMKELHAVAEEIRALGVKAVWMGAPASLAVFQPGWREPFSSVTITPLLDCG